MKDYEVKIARLEILGVVLDSIEYRLEDEVETLKRYLGEESEPKDYWTVQQIEKYTVRVKTLEELIKLLNSDDKKLPWNNNNPF